MTPQQIDSLHEALSSAFPMRGELSSMLYRKLGKSLDQLVSPAGLEQAMAELIQNADARGEVDNLIHAAYAERPNNPKLREFYSSYFGAPPGTGSTGTSSAPVPGSPAAQSRRLRLVYCHAPKDASFGSVLERHLTLLVKNSLIDRPWSEAMIRPGQVRQREIETAWNAADLIILMISADFLYANDEDLQRAERRRGEGATVIPIIVRPVGWRDSSIGTLEAFPRDESGVVKPVSKWGEPEDAWINVADAIRAEIDARNDPSQQRPR